MNTSAPIVKEHEINDQDVSVNSKYVKKYDNSGKVNDHRYAYEKVRDWSDYLG